MLLAGIPLAVVRKIACFAKHGVGNVIFAGAIRIHYGGNHTLRHFGIVCQQLFGVFGQTVAAVAKRGVIIVCANARVEPHARNNGFRVQSLHIGISVELVEIRHTECQIGVGKQFHRLCLFQAHKQGVDVFLNGTLLQQSGKGFGKLLRLRIADGIDSGILFLPPLLQIGRQKFGIAHDNARGPQIIFQRLRLAQKFRRKQQIEMLAFQRRVGEKLQRILHIKLSAIAHRNGRLNHHHRIRIHTQHQINHIFNVVRVEKILHRVVVGGCRNHNVVGIPVSRSAIKRGSEIQLLFSKIFFDIIILNRTLAAINFIHLFRYHIHSLHLMMLRKQSGNR